MIAQVATEPAQSGGLTDWLNVNASAVQAVAAILIIILTGVLVAVTIYYARANWHVVHAMEKDLQSRIQPRLLVDVQAIPAGPDHPENDDYVHIEVKVTRNGPAIIKAIELFLSKKGGGDEEINTGLLDVRVVEGGGTSCYCRSKMMDFDFWHAKVWYSDELNLFQTEGSFIMSGTGVAETIIPDSSTHRAWAKRAFTWGS